HMVADTVTELLSMADTIGLSRRWFQDKSFPHFDVCQEYRDRAIEAGARVVDNRQLVTILKRLRRKK
ncbi:MAG: DUF4031 domain-containing protein, partial [Deltaproteobacteria bacterium]|nr:DUF4031 domain-containing protein [Deltaproteobacteria bacterium]